MPRPPSLLARLLRRLSSRRECVDVDALVDENRALRDELDARAAFQRAMSHELRTPLNGVLGVGELLLETELDDVQRELVETCDRSARSLFRLLEDDFDSARDRPTPVEVTDAPFDVVAAIEGAVAAARDGVAERHVEVELIVVGDVPDRASGDERRLVRIVGELLSNAVRFTEAGRVVVTARAEALDDRVQLEVEVTDGGVGIDACDLERVVRPFVRGRAAAGDRSGARDGHGLGLTIASRLVESMGGSLSLSSIPGEGTTARVSLPLGSAVTEDSNAGKLRGARILAVADDDDARRILTTTLRALGATADVVAEGSAAVRLAGAAPYDLVVLDLSAASSDLPRWLRDIRSTPLQRGTPIVVVAGDVVDATLSEAGADRCASRAGLSVALVETLAA